MKKLIPIEQNDLDITHIEINLYYHIGGDNYPRARERGYYLRVSPVSRVNRDGYIMETFDARYRGITQCVKPVQRKSARAEQEAQQRAAQIEQVIIEIVCSKNNISIMEV